MAVEVTVRYRDGTPEEANADLDKILGQRYAYMLGQVVGVMFDKKIHNMNVWKDNGDFVHISLLPDQRRDRVKL